jgi:hypothetical protein
VLLVALLSTLAVACGGDSDSDGSDDVVEVVGPSDDVASSPDSNYCDDLLDLTHVLDDGGSVADYNQLLGRITAEAPAGHADTWALMLELSSERFTYENFNPAVDALEQLETDLAQTCPGLDAPKLVVDDDGRVRQSSGG